MVQPIFTGLFQAASFVSTVEDDSESAVDSAVAVSCAVEEVAVSAVPVSAVAASAVEAVSAVACLVDSAADSAVEAVVDSAAEEVGADVPEVLLLDLSDFPASAVASAVLAL